MGYDNAQGYTDCQMYQGRENIRLRQTTTFLVLSGPSNPPKGDIYEKLAYSYQ